LSEAVDIAVALLTYNNAETVKAVAAAAAAGLAQHFPGTRAAVIDADAGSSDGTVEGLEAAGLPVVVTRTVWDGLPAEVLPACRLADHAGEFAREIVDLLTLTPAERRAIALRARVSELTWSRRVAPLVRLIERAAGPGASGDLDRSDARARSRQPSMAFSASRR